MPPFNIRKLFGLRLLFEVSSFKVHLKCQKRNIWHYCLNNNTKLWTCTVKIDVVVMQLCHVRRSKKKIFGEWTVDTVRVKSTKLSSFRPQQNFKDASEAASLLPSFPKEKVSQKFNILLYWSRWIDKKFLHFCLFFCIKTVIVFMLKFLNFWDSAVIFCFLFCQVFFLLLLLFTDEQIHPQYWQNLLRNPLWIKEIYI
jgi:hypothetical protein